MLNFLFSSRKPANTNSAMRRPAGVQGNRQPRVSMDAHAFFDTVSRRDDRD